MLFAGAVPDAQIWDELLTAPPAGGRLVLVHAADQLAEFGPLDDLLDGGEGITAVLLSAEPDFARDGKALVPHLARLQDSRHGQLIRCCAPSRREDQAKMIASWWPGAGLDLGYRVLQRSGQSLTRAWEACDKARRAQLAPEPRWIDLVCLAEPGDSFADALVTGDKAAAVAAARGARQPDIGAGLGLLASRLAALASIADALRAGATAADLASRTRLDRFVLHMLAAHAPGYDATRVRRCREVLAAAESAWRAGAVTGVAESVIALW